jgi:hypothetical protein
MLDLEAVDYSSPFEAELTFAAFRYWITVLNF